MLIFGNQPNNVIWFGRRVQIEFLDNIGVTCGTTMNYHSINVIMRLCEYRNTLKVRETCCWSCTALVHLRTGGTIDLMWRLESGNCYQNLLFISKIKTPHAV